VKSDLENVRTAAEQFLDKTPHDREAAIRLVMEGHLRGIVGQLTVEQIVKEPEMVGDKVRSTCAGDLAKMGLDMISFTIKEVRDQNEYIRNMGLPDIERVKKEANIATAEAQRDTEIKRAMAMREAAVARAQADQERVIAETASMSKQAEAQRDLEVKRAQYQELVQRQKAQADKAYEIQTSVMQQQVVVEQVRVLQVERNEQVKVQESEIARRKNELIATELEPANVQAQRRQVLADGEKRALELEAAGRAQAIRQQGQAEAEIIRMKGEAEAAAMDRKAEAYRGYGQAAVLDKLLSGLPEVVRAISEPLGRVDRITVISTGDGDGSGGAGVSKITADIAKMVAQVPTLVEALSGISVGELLKNLPQLGQAIRAAQVPGKRGAIAASAGSTAGSDPEIEMIPDDPAAT
jgi:flotillin